MIAIRPMTPDDWPQVAAIYAEGLATGVATFETEPPTWQRWDEAHLPAPRLVAEEHVVSGWVAASPVSSRPCYRGVVEHSVYVAGAARGRGIGRALLDAFVAVAPEHGIWTIQTAIFATNEPSLELHRRCGFSAGGLPRADRAAKRHLVRHDPARTPPPGLSCPAGPVFASCNAGRRPRGLLAPTMEVQVPQEPPIEGTSDAALLDAARDDPHAFRVLYDRYATRVHAFHLRRTRNPDSAHDLTAETFAQAWLSRTRFRDAAEGSAGPWLFAIARNVLVTSVRRGVHEDAARRKLGLLEPGSTSQHVPEESWLDDLDELLDELPQGQSDAIRLRVIDDLPYEDVASTLGISQEAARVRVHRGLAALRSTLVDPTEAS